MNATTRGGLCVPGTPVAIGARRLGIILVVEDDPAVAALLAVLLKPAAAAVLVADSRESCEAILADTGAELSLAILDCSLPDLDVGVLSEHLRARAPALPVLLTSGRAQADALKRVASDGPADFLPKPYRPADVLHRVQGFLTRTA
jgi:DNA-binding response OmpR family regulator